ncbi:hypothetical protein [Sphingomonas sp. SUN039]|uniref:hypothetical protein n=1 Tax=Sphingomonas sp. SUN039 TaxID=2937787 RepID=UPI0021649C3F|nr:hypothetical protein [Sphingomonas sp. SUN039]UVO55321.1 hypothetical protein M0209_14745 [Sphingomonas sp. SUN039]
MFALALLAAAVGLAVGPEGADPRRVADQGLGPGIVGRMAVVFPDPARRTPRDRATIYLKLGGSWCRVGSGNYVRGSNFVDRGGYNPSIRLIDRHERATDLSWRDGRLVLMRRGQHVQTLDVPANGCK